VAQRPANLHADALTLRPKAGDWGPVHLSVVKLGPVPNADGHTALVFVNAGSRGSGLIVGLPNLTFAPASARTVQLSSEPLSAGDKLSPSSTPAATPQARRVQTKRQRTRRTPTPTATAVPTVVATIDDDHSGSGSGSDDSSGRGRGRGRGGDDD